MFDLKRIIVIGAGILGAATAYHLTERGASVTLIDRKDTGQATAAAAGIICPWLTNRRNTEWYKLVTEGAKYYPELMERLSEYGTMDPAYRQVGAINIFSKDKMLDKKYELALARQKDTPEMGKVTKLSESETKALFPPLKDGYSAVHISGGGRVDGASLRDTLIHAATSRGMTYKVGSASLIQEGNRITGVNDNQERMSADEVVVTGGVWAKEILKPLGIDFLLTSQKAQIVHLNIPDTDTSDWPVVMPPFGQYFLAFDGGKIVLGATAENHAGEDARVTMGGVHEVIDKALRVAPGFATTTYVGTKVGFRPFTPESLPAIGRLPGLDGLFIANGLGSSGLTSGPYIGKELAKLVMEEQAELDVKEYPVSSAIRE
ncbi:NAD(P)/FAD-dependent oxidoreductase [Thalassobacillus hwangdonensis]|uniref:NAD(P)/FAD-dependent oxidoreductase n=1 Tax=Thalassobacillus hwangdonensis TaxID=546108 RepID=A0ABW3L0M5_9BACI